MTRYSSTGSRGGQALGRFRRKRFSLFSGNGGSYRTASGALLAHPQVRSRCSRHGPHRPDRQRPWVRRVAGFGDRRVRHRRVEPSPDPGRAHYVGVGGQPDPGWRGGRGPHRNTAPRGSGPSAAHGHGHRGAGGPSRPGRPEHHGDGHGRHRRAAPGSPRPVDQGRGALVVQAEYGAGRGQTPPPAPGGGCHPGTAAAVSSTRPH